ncbi:MAG: NADH-quinone oxidoreductase subunit N [Bacteroidota bacterium]|nr:NADH-quinone oxidoreductase subunit N [Bacteroidota bacterium]
MNTLIAITGIGIVAMLAEIFSFRKVLFPLVLTGLAIALGLAVLDWNTNIRHFNDMMYFDNYAISFTVVMLVTVFLWFLISSDYVRNSSHETDFTSLIIFSLAGGVIMVSFADLTMLFLGLEILSIAMYIMAAANKSELRSNEAGFKYFMLGAFATGFLLFGIALVYGAVGSFNLQEISGYVSANRGNLPVIFNAGVVLMLVGLIFKVSAAPFHFWAPDVYEGAPSPVTAYMSTVVKTAAFAAFLRLFLVCFSSLADWWGPLLAICSALTMLAGNILAVYQKSIKRMLAYSSISHAGYMLMAIVAMNQNSDSALLLYTAAYSIGSIGIFTLVLTMTKNQNETLSALKGFATVNKVPAFIISVIMLSLAGIPPVAGFFAKYYVFTTTLQSDYTWLVILAVISSLVGVYYYFKVIIAMYQPADRDSVQMEFSPMHHLVLWITLVITVGLGVAPGFLLSLI